MDDFSRHPSGTLWALRFAAGIAADLPEPTIDLSTLPPSDWVWLHFPLGDVRARAFIKRGEGLPNGFRELVESQDDRVQLHGEGAWAFGVLPDFERDLAGNTLGPGRLYFACDARRLITGRLHALRAIDDVRHEAEAGQVFEGPGGVLASQIESLNLLMEGRLDRLTDQLDVMEDMVLSERTDFGEMQLGPLRRELARHRRELQSLRSAFLRGRSGREALRANAVVAQVTPGLSEVEDMDREFAGLQERARLMHEEIDILINSATNRSMRTLTVISTLLIPPTLVVGAFGMNLPGMPFEHSQSGFAAASFICVALVVGALVVLRRLQMLS